MRIFYIRCWIGIEENSSGDAVETLQGILESLKNNEEITDWQIGKVKDLSSIIDKELKKEDKES